MKKQQHNNSGSEPTTEHRIEAVLFERDLDGHRVGLEDLDGRGRLDDDQLLWIDVTLGSVGGIPDALARYGIEARYLQPGDTSLTTTSGDWSYLYARALNSAAATHFSEEALVVGIGHNVVVTAHHRPIDFLVSVLENQAGQLRVGSLHAGSFAASLLDRMLTAVFDAIDGFEDRVDALEMQILAPDVRSGQVGQLRQLRRAVSMLRRLLTAHRSLFDALTRPDFMPDRSRAVAAQFLAVSARYQRAMDAVENARDLVVGSFELLATRLSQRTNESVHGLTFYTVLLGSLALAAGVLGMNFQASLFDSGTRGFWTTIGIMLLVIVLALTYAHRQGWWRR